MNGMSDKTIKKVASKKIKDWLSSIEDEDVRSVASKNVILTGGSLSSMIMGEKINDYDIYFKTKEALLKVVKYYLEKSKSMRNEYDESFSYDIQELGDNRERIYIKIDNTGAVDNNEYLDDLDDNDIDFNSEDERGKYVPLFITSNAITLSQGIQIVVRFYGEPYKIHKNFDFVHATCSFDYSSGELITPIEALRSMQSKKLQYKGSLYPICSLFRIRKFLDRGWKINAGQITKIAFQISELDLSDLSVLEDQLVGVDYVYMMNFIDIVKELDKDKLNSSYMGEIIDKVFP